MAWQGIPETDTWLRALEQARAFAPTQDRAHGLVCELCGREPATRLSLKATDGYVLFRRTHEFEQPLCKSCSKGIYREYQSRNLSRGWWGLQSFLATGINLLSNMRGFRKSQKMLGAPSSGSPQIEEGLEGTPIYRRVGTWVLPAVLVGLFVLGALAPPTKAIDDLTIGDCFIDTDEDEVFSVEVTDCDEPHDAEVYALAQYPAGDEVAYPGRGEIEGFSDEECFTAFEGYVGASYAESTFDFGYFYPTRGSWEDGDRQVTCMVASPSGQLLSSVRGSGQ